LFRIRHTLQSDEPLFSIAVMLTVALLYWYSATVPMTATAHYWLTFPVGALVVLVLVAAARDRLRDGQRQEWLRRADEQDDGSAKN
jgi:hypothetical protein